MSPIVVRTAQDLISLAPILCGFHPSESVVMIAVAADGRTAAAVVDVPQTVGEWVGVRTGLMESVAKITRVVSIERLGLVVFSTDLAYAEQFLTFLADNGVGSPVFARVAAGSDEWAEVSDTGEVRREPYRGTSTVEVEAVMAGVAVAVPAADELSTQVAPVPTLEGAQRFATLVSAIKTPMTPDLIRVWFDQWTLSGYPTIDTDQAAALVAAIQTPNGRDTAMIMMSRSDAEQYSHLWRSVSAQVAGAIAQPVLTLSSMATWLNGYGRQARLINNRAKDEAAGQPNPMQGLIEGLLDRGMSPDIWAGLRDSVRDDLDAAPR